VISAAQVPWLSSQKADRWALAILAGKLAAAAGEARQPAGAQPGR
jgi:hypothetical protein